MHQGFSTDKPKIIVNKYTFLLPQVNLIIDFNF